MYAYGALVSKPESRATRLALFDGMESLFVVIGTVLSPIIKNNFGRYTNYGLKVGCTSLALLYTIFLVKEPPKSDKGKGKNHQKLSIITPLLSFVDLIKTVFKRWQDFSYMGFFDFRTFYKAELLQINRTQFPSLGIFVSKKGGNLKN